MVLILLLRLLQNQLRVGETFGMWQRIINPGKVVDDDAKKMVG